jgi:hypothetical protein
MDGSSKSPPPQCDGSMRPIRSHPTKQKILALRIQLFPRLFDWSSFDKQEGHMTDIIIMTM